MKDKTMRTIVVRGKEIMADQTVEQAVRGLFSNVGHKGVDVLQELGRDEPGSAGMVGFLQERGADGQEVIDAVSQMIKEYRFEEVEVYDEIVKQVRQHLADEDETLAASSGGQREEVLQNGS